MRRAAKHEVLKKVGQSGFPRLLKSGAYLIQQVEHRDLGTGILVDDDF
jgi:hypothetical protein